MKFLSPLLGLGLMVLPPVNQATPLFYTGPLWDAHSHVDEGSGGNTKAKNIVIAMNGAVAGTPIWVDSQVAWPENLPGIECLMLFPKLCLDGYMLNTLATNPALQNCLVTAIGFQNQPLDTECNNGGWKEYPTAVPYDPDELYDPAGDQFLNDVEARAASGSYQWLGEVPLYGKLGEKAEIKADLFHQVIEARIHRVLMIAARFNLPVTFHHTVTDVNGGAIPNLNGTGGSNETAKEHFLNILRTHANEVSNDPDIDEPAIVIWAHWGGLSSATTIEDMIDGTGDDYPNLYFDLAWFHKGEQEISLLQSRLLKEGCYIANLKLDINNLALCEFTDKWKNLINLYPGRFLAGVDAGTNSKYKDDYRVRELMLRTALGGLAYAVAESVAANNQQQLLGVDSVPADGDITIDGGVNAADVQSGQQVLGGSASMTPLQFKHGNVAPLVDGIPVPDNLFTSGDLLIIKEKALGQINF